MKTVFTWITGCILLAHGLRAQTITLTLIQPDCSSDGIIEATVSGMTPPYDIRYISSGAGTVGNHTNLTLSSDQCSGLTGSSFTAELSQGGTVITTSAPLIVPKNISVAGLPVICSYTCPASATTVSLTITGVNPPYTIEWRNELIVGSPIQTTSNPAQLSKGVYTFTVTDNQGCTVRGIQTPGPTGPVIVNYDSQMSYTVTTSNPNCTDGNAWISSVTGGTLPLSYLWFNGSTSSNISNLTMGPVSVRVTDANGCYQEEYGTVYPGAIISNGFTTIDADCLQSNGSATVFATGGQPPYSYLWSNGLTSSSISNLPGNSLYSVAITDVNGCINDLNYNSVNIHSSTPITVSYTSSVSQCTLATGSLSLSISGGQTPYTISWPTLPGITTSVVSNVFPGNYPFIVTDLNGCTQSGTVTISSVSHLTAVIGSTPEVCHMSNGTCFINAFSVGAAPYTYAWSNSNTTSAITGISSGLYACVVTDNMGCQVTKQVYVNEVSSMTIGFITTSSSCLFTNDGSINTAISGGTAPYTYQWSNGSTSQNLTGLGQGGYYLTVTDALGCVEHQYTNVSYNAFNTSCYCMITGSVFDDVNLNCIQDPGETGIPNVRIGCTGIGYTYTNINGLYHYSVPTGTYVITEYAGPNYNVASCQSSSVTVTSNPLFGCVLTVDFANTWTPVHDVKILTTSLNQPVPGNSYTQRTVITNKGNITENTIQESYAQDGQLSFSSSSFPMSQPNGLLWPNWYTVTTPIPATLPNASFINDITYNVPTTIPVGTVIHFKDTTAYMAPLTSAWLSDYTPWNNVEDYQATIVSSYDPNFKEVNPKGTGAAGMISYSDSLLEYVIHFQNTGTYMAQNIVITDSLDADLDWTTFEPGYADHTYTAFMDLNGMVTFKFSNIHLPFSGDASHGMVSYRIKTKKNLMPGTEFKNTASIFFDYNAPVITNTTLNTLMTPNSIKDIKGNAMSLVVYPNPTEQLIHVMLPSEKGTLKIMDMLGKTVAEQPAQDRYATLSVIQFPQGIYTIQYSTHDGLTYTAKFIKL